jgi:hypothetical protein
LDSATDAAGSDQSVDRGGSVDDIIIASETVNRRLPARAAERKLDKEFAICIIRNVSKTPNYPDGFPVELMCQLAQLDQIVGNSTSNTPCVVS